MEARLKPVPAFYCCYLLRSTVRQASLYVGSSPNPSRRLAQHNGRVKGGAARTSRLNLRPWEMVCVVNGFPSNIAALQFEWAWQNAHLTRHIPAEKRLTSPSHRVVTNSRTGKTRKKRVRPRSTLMDRLAYLHLLLQVPYFGKWPLQLRFFNSDVFSKWQAWCERTEDCIQGDVSVILDVAQQSPDASEEISSAQRPAKRRKMDLIGKGGVDGVDPTYAKYQGVLEKTCSLFKDSHCPRCNLCAKSIALKSELFVVCSDTDCQGIYHMLCLSDKFLENGNCSSVVPTKGCCPSCQKKLEWSELMRALTVQVRGQKEVEKLLAKSRKSKAAIAAELLEDSDESEQDELDLLDDINEDGEEDVDDSISVSSWNSVESSGLPRKLTENENHDRLEIVIEDSEDER